MHAVLNYFSLLHSNNRALVFGVFFTVKTKNNISTTLVIESLISSLESIYPHWLLHWINMLANWPMARQRLFICIMVHLSSALSEKRTAFHSRQGSDAAPPKFTLFSLWSKDAETTLQRRSKKESRHVRVLTPFGTIKSYCSRFTGARHCLRLQRQVSRSFDRWYRNVLVTDPPTPTPSGCWILTPHFLPHLVIYSPDRLLWSSKSRRTCLHRL